MTAHVESYTLKDGKTVHHRVRQKIGGRKTSLTVGESADLAHDKAILLEAERIHGKVGLVDPKKTVGQHVKKYLEYSELTKSERTYKIEHYALQPFLNAFQNRKLIDLRKHDLDEFMLSLLKVRGTNGVKMLLRIVHTCLEYARLPSNPCKGVDILQEVEVARIITDDEMNSILNVIKNRFREILLIARNTGMREGEILKLDTNKHFFGGSIKIERHQMKNRRAKKKEPKEIPILEPIEFLKEYVRLKVGRIYHDWDKDRVDGAWRWYKIKARIKGAMRFHDLKHTFCSNWKGDIATLCRITGNTWESLQKYVHSDENMLKIAMEKSVFTPDSKWGQNGHDPIQTRTNTDKDKHLGKEGLSTVIDGKPGLRRRSGV